MVSKKYVNKNINLFGRATEEDMTIINKISRVPLSADDVVVFTIRMCDGLVDRVFDQLSDTFLSEFAALANEKHLTGLKDHNWSIDSQWARLLKAEVKTDEKGVTYVEGRIYTLAANEELIEKIKTGIAGEISISFNGESHCSICGNTMEKWSMDDTGYDGIHHAGEEYEGEICLNIYDHCTDALEFSLVAVPCQPNASVIKSLSEPKRQAAEDIKQPVVTDKTTGGTSMTKKTFALKKLMAKFKSIEQQDDEQVNDLLDVLSNEDEEEKELDAADIQALLDENEQLKNEIEKLKSEIEDLKAKAADDVEKAEGAAIDSVLNDEVDKLGCHTPTVKECMLRDIDRKVLKLVDGKVEGLTEVMEPILKKYEGLYGKKEPASSKSEDMPKVSFGKPGNKVERKSFHDACSKM